MDNQFAPEKYFDLTNYMHKELFEGVEFVWEAFNRSEKYLEKLFSETPKDQWIQGEVSPQAILKGDVIVAAGAKVEPTAYIEGPCYIGPRSIVGTAAYIRGLTILGERSIIGHCTEAKNTIMLDYAAAPHFNFIGDCIMGARSNIGAGVILANYRLDAKEVPAGDTTTGMVKFGAILGDEVKVGCNAVLEPGMFIQKDTWVGPTQYLRRGVYKKGERHSDVIRFEKEQLMVARNKELA